MEAIRGHPAASLVCSDFDGTLAPIVERAQDARADPAALRALAELAPKVGRVALITGRPAAAVLEMGAVTAIPGVLVAGHYGLDRWYDGTLTVPPADPAVALARARLPELPAGAYVEDKGLSFVVHTRPAGDPEAALQALDGPLRALALEQGLEVVDGSFARELRPRGTDKGDVIRELAAGMRALLYLGDDDGDLPAAAALLALREAGVTTMLVCAARTGGSAALASAADVVVDGVDGVTAWLSELSAALDRD